MDKQYMLSYDSLVSGVKRAAIVASAVLLLSACSSYKKDENYQQSPEVNIDGECLRNLDERHPNIKEVLRNTSKPSDSGVGYAFEGLAGFLTGTRLHHYTSKTERGTRKERTERFLWEEGLKECVQFNF